MRTKVLLSCFFLSILLVSCVKEPEPIKVTGITLNSENLLLYEDETADLMATISPKDADNQTVLWSSSNGSVASVYNGKVTALKAGATTITAKSDDGGFTASCAVTVVSKTIEVSSITLSKSELTLTEGESETLVAMVKPDDATDKTVTWSSSDASTATVEDGKVTAVKEGSATITAKAGDKTATCLVSVAKRIISVESVELDKTELDLVEGDSYTLTATVKPDDATDKAITWSSSDSNIVSVEEGKVTAIKEGSATITARAGDKTATCEINVAKKVIPVESITLNKVEFELFEGETEVLFATVKPDDATDKTVTWKSSDSSIATVEDGKVTAIKKGTAIISALAGDKTATSVVTVKYDDPNNIKFADIKLKQKLVQAFDTNNDGELSYAEAEAVTSIGGAITIKTITSFDEFQYFTGVTAIPDECFSSWTKLNSIVLPKSIKSIGSHAFSDCLSLPSLVIPDSVTSVGASAFSDCSKLSSVIIPSSVTSVGSNAFSHCSSLASVSIPNSVTSIEERTFLGCSSLTSVVIPNKVNSIGEMAFFGCSNLVSVVIPNSVTTIEDAAFYYCSNLTSVVIPNSVTSIGVDVFRSCPRIESITVDAGNSSFDSRNNCNAIIETKTNCLIVGCKNTIIPEGIRSIGYDAFADCSELYTIIIPESVTSIGNQAFSGCSSLISVVIPESISIIVNNMFSGCSSLTSIIIPESITKIEQYAFYGCVGLSFITVMPTTPPKGSSDMFLRTNDCPICVPENSIELYETTYPWSNYKSRFHAIGTPIPSDIPEAIDLGLSVKWASCNLGAFSPYGLGHYFAWGETEPKSTYSWANYKWCNGTSTGLTKYCTVSSYGYEGFTDGKITLDPEDDAAYVKLGGKWRMPTPEEQNELFSKCTLEKTSIKGVTGLLLTGPNGNSIFLPYAGVYDGSSFYSGINGGYYMSSSIYPNYPDKAESRYIFPDSYRWNETSRYYGKSIRPVYAE